MTQEYYFKKGAMQLGPYPLEKMRALARQGQVGRSYQISSDGGASWSSGSEFSEIFAGDDTSDKKLARPCRSPSTARTTGTEAEWYYCPIGGDQQGPVAEAQLRQMIELGVVGSLDTVWTELFGEKWVPAGSVPKFAGLFAAAAPIALPATRATQGPSGVGQGFSGGTEGVFCRECGARINRRAVVCPQCGVPAEDPASAHLAGPADRHSQAGLSRQGGRGTSHRSRVTAALLAFLVGGLGVHHFYLGNGLIGILYLLFCWTFIPAILAFIEAIVFLTMSDDAFDARYNA